LGVKSTRFKSSVWTVRFNFPSLEYPDPSLCSPQRFGVQCQQLVHLEQQDGQRVNFGANLILWDRLFGTAAEPNGYPTRYGTANAPGPWRQLLFPW
jgi:hypothetical protein